MSSEVATAPTPKPVRFASLRYPVFRNFWVANTISSVGNSMEIPIRNWLIWTLSHDPLMLALSAAAHWAPFFLLSLYAGVAADRVERRQMLAVSQIVLLGTTFGLAAMVFSGWSSVWWVIGLTLVHGIAESLGSPARLSLVSDIVKKDHVMNAVALNSTALQIAKFVGPALGGLAIGVVGMGGALLINAGTYVPYIIVIITLSLAPMPYKAKAETMWRNLLESFRYMRQHSSLLALVMVIGIPSIFSAQYRTLLPVFSDNILHVGVIEYGILSAASGLGSLMAGLTLSYVHEVRRKGFLILLTAGLSGVFTFLFGISPWFIGTLIFLVGIGATQVIYSALANTAMQVSAPDDMRGRVMGFFSWGNSGMTVIGSLEAGVLADAAGAPITMIVAGVATMLAVPLALWLAPSVRRVE